eukprot:Rhum_TRINITY_DN8523_c0_g1::Rhum_TRINITY_DN8523_c0_g1_i1::g.28519::m.28519/K02993/RP-S7e, RPS7; small subunit ribosomal protein S7e
MSTPSMEKIRKSRRASATHLEKEVATVLFNMEVNSKAAKSVLAGLYINSVRELEVTATKKAAIVFFPIRFIRKFHKIQKQLVAELEKKLNMQVILMAQRKISRRKGTSANPVPRNMTMKAVHEAILDDICYPHDIVGKRIRQKTDGSKHLKVYLHRSEKDKAHDTLESKLDTFALAYKTLTSREVSFGFMSNAQMQQIVA